MELIYSVPGIMERDGSSGGGVGGLESLLEFSSYPSSSGSFSVAWK
jgi:hypothetical protein